MKISSSLNRKLGAILSIVNLLVSVLIGMVYTPICVRSLGQSEYGLYTFAFGLVSYLSILDFGFGSALVRFSSMIDETNNDERSKLYGFFLSLFTVIGLIAAIIGFLICININNLFSNSFTTNELYLLNKIFPWLLVNISLGFPCGVFSAILQSHEEFVFLRTVDIIKSICSHLCIVAVLLMGYKVFALTVVTVIFSFVVYFINAFVCLFKLKIRFKFHLINIKISKQIFRYSFFVFLGIIGTKLYNETDKLVLGYYSGSREVAIYGVAITFFVYFQILSLSITNVFFPLLSRLVLNLDATKQISNLFNKISRFLLIILEFFLFGFIAFGREFTILWVGSEYSDSYIISLIILLPNLIPLSQNLGNSILEALNKHKVSSIMFIVMALFNVLISIPLTIRLGGIGAALGTAITTVIGQIVFMNLYYAKNIKLEIKVYWYNFVLITTKYLPVILVMFFLNYQFSTTSWNFLFLKIAMSCIVSIPYIYYFIMDVSERKMILNFFDSFKTKMRL